MNKTPHLLQGLTLARMTLVGSASVTAGLSYATPSSVTWLLLDRAGAVGDVVMLVFVTGLFMALADFFINDVLPEGVHFAWARANRWLWISLLGVCYLFMATAATLTPQPAGAWVLVAGYAWNGAMCMAWSMAHALQRLQATRSEAETSLA